ncbi:MAG: fructosamine kinase family protein, partial [Verrucomicrobiota bacterium]|nr:fructosamine kinase family protein [Verrucomicrobiota bacterium]
MLTRVTGVDLLTAKATPVRGGCIHQAFCVENDGIKFFLKLNTRDKGLMLDAEFEALQQLKKTQTLQVPEPIAHGVDNGFA